MSPDGKPEQGRRSPPPPRAVHPQVAGPALPGFLRPCLISRVPASQQGDRTAFPCLTAGETETQSEEALCTKSHGKLLAERGQTVAGRFWGLCQTSPPTPPQVMRVPWAVTHLELLLSCYKEPQNASGTETVSGP